MATRIGPGSGITRSLGDLEFTHEGRTTRFGRLRRPSGSDGREVRCACTACGAHLYARQLGRDHYEGVCMVCGNREVTAVVP